jgi:hypothetical protein
MGSGLGRFFFGVWITADFSNSTLCWHRECTMEAEKIAGFFSWAVTEKEMNNHVDWKFKSLRKTFGNGVGILVEWWILQFLIFTRLADGENREHGENQHGKNFYVRNFMTRDPHFDFWIMKETEIRTKRFMENVRLKHPYKVMAKQCVSFDEVLRGFWRKS